MSYKYIFKVFLSIENEAINRINKNMEAFIWKEGSLRYWTDLWNMTVTVENKLSDEDYKTLLAETEKAYTEVMQKDIEWAKINLTLKSQADESNNT